jgi:hypothetical protein
VRSGKSQDCAKIRTVIESLSILGPDAIDSVICELDIMGISLGKKCASLGMIAEGLRYMYGDEVAEMLMQRVFLKLDELYSCCHNHDNCQERPDYARTDYQSVSQGVG